jgi:RNA-directed DNA polymerase
MTDGAMQALYLLGLDPIAETLADGHSYGFRRERCCADALDQCHKVLRGPHGRGSYGPDWIFEGDIKSCFDRIGHGWLMDHIFMDREVLGKWLKAGYLEKHALFATPTSRGTLLGTAESRTLPREDQDHAQ